MSRTGPLVSVVVTNHDYGRFLPDSLGSVLSQSYPHTEVIVVDDGSTDGSREILEGYPVRAIHQAQAGQAAALDAGVAAAKGDIVCLLDADDVWAPSKVERVVEALTASPGAQWVRHPLEIVDDDLRPTGSRLPAIPRSGAVAPSPAAVAERVLTVSTSALAFRRSVVPAAFPLARSSGLRFDADALLLARLAAALPGWQIADVLGYYRRHPAQQYADAGDLRRMLTRQVEVGTMIAEALGRPDPVSNFKHRLVIAALDGRPRGREVIGGLSAGLRLASEPRIMIRQIAALLYAAAAPGRWMGRIRRLQGFE